MNPLAYQPRRPVPWKGIDVALLLALLLSPFWISFAMRPWLPEAKTPAPAAKDAPLETAHPLARVLAESRSVWPLLLGIALATVIAPITEELIFRLLLQGWLESLERRWRRRLHIPCLLLGAAPILVIAALFAAIHYRQPQPRQELDVIIHMLNVQAVWCVLFVVVLVCWLKYGAKASPADFGVDLQKLPSDIGLGLMAAFVIVGPTYLVMAGIAQTFPYLLENPWSSPVLLFPLALTLGFLYYRTHRIVPAIALHMAFNAAGIAVALTFGR